MNDILFPLKNSPKPKFCESSQRPVSDCGFNQTGRQRYPPPSYLDLVKLKLLDFHAVFFATLRLHFFFELLTLALKIPPEIRAELRRG